MILDRLTSTNSINEGILLNDVAGTFTVTGTTTIDNPSFEGIEIDNIFDPATTISFGQVDITNRNDRGISIQSMNGATVDFGATTIGALNGGAGGGVEIVFSGADFTFASVDIADSNSEGFVYSSNAGDLTVTGTLAPIVLTNNRALNLDGNGFIVLDFDRLEITSTTGTGLGGISVASFPVGSGFVDATYGLPAV